MSTRTFTVTAGHGGNDPGALGPDCCERDLMTELRDIVAAKLRTSGANVRTDGAAWQNLPLVHALTLVPGAEWAIELHTNAAPSPEATGVEVVAMPSDKARAQRLAQAIAKTLGLRVRGDAGWIDQTSTARGRLGFVRAGGMVVEVFFISNPDDLASYQAKKWLAASTIAAVLIRG
jgi:N-acetylmuramoyl-L-alanine amidase